MGRDVLIAPAAATAVSSTAIDDSQFPKVSCIVRSLFESAAGDETRLIAAGSKQFSCSCHHFTRSEPRRANRGNAGNCLRGAVLK